MKLAAAPTFRDIGGAVANDGRRVRQGLIYRAGHLMQPSGIEQEFVRQLGLQRIFDLRSEPERHLHPSNWVGACTVPLDVDTEFHPGSVLLLKMLEEECSESSAWNMMLQTYRNFPVGFRQPLRALFDALLDEQNCPALIHCSAGKDRTGFACAMVLHALGVNEAGVIEDYLQTGNVLIGTPIADAIANLLAGCMERPPGPAAIAVIMGVRREFMVSALDAARAEFGSIDDYLAQVAGLDAARRERLRERFLAS